MEAKDTVMNEEQRDIAIEAVDISNLNFWEVIQCNNETVLQTQAEISFKAGLESGNQKAYECGVYNGKAEGVAEGIGLVVEWITEWLKRQINWANKMYEETSGTAYKSMAIDYIQVLDAVEAKLKNWGL